MQYRYNYKKKKDFYLPLLFFTFPVFSLPLIIKNIFNGRYYALHYLSLFMGLMSYLFAPTGDLYRYYKDYNLYKSFSFNKFWEYINFDILHQTILYIFARLDIYIGFFRMFICVLCYELIFSVLKDLLINSPIKDKKKKFLIILFFICIIGFTPFLRGIRFYLAASFLIYAYYSLYFKKRNLRSFVFFILASFTHYSVFPVVVLLLFFRYFPVRISRFYALFLLGVCWLLSATVLTSSIEMLKLGMEMQQRLDYYTTGYYAVEFLDDHSFKFWVSQILSTMIFYPIVVVMFIRLKSFKGMETIILLIGLIIIARDMYTVTNRYALLSILLFAIPFIINKGNFFKEMDFKILFLVGLVSYFFSIYTFKRELSVGYVGRAFYAPMPVILMTTYDKQWMNSNVYDSGDFKYNIN